MGAEGCIGYDTGIVRRAISHINAESSRAMAVVFTVLFLPRGLSRRYRAVSRDCAFQAMF